MATNVGESLEPRLNYYIISVIFIAILLFTLANSLEPQIDAQLDFFELIFILGSAATSIFSFVVGFRYWPSKIFGHAYLALGIAYALTCVGSALFNYFQITGMSNPYPYYPDVFFAAFYPFAIFHLRKNIKYFRGAHKSTLQRKQLGLLIAIPLGITLVYAYGAWIYDPSFALFDLDKAASDTIESDMGSLNLIPRIFLLSDNTVIRDSEFINGYLTGIYFVSATSFVFAWTIVGAQIFRKSVLGLPWGLLLVGIGLNTIADVSYYYTSIEGYDRSNPIISLWMLGYMFVCYALYIHKKQL